MVVLLMERVSASLRGHLTRWLIELKPGVFVGTISADVRDRLWQYVTERTRSGAAYLVHAAQTEQRFTIRSHGLTLREIVDFDGIQLVKVRGELPQKPDA